MGFDDWASRPAQESPNEEVLMVEVKDNAGNYYKAIRDRNTGAVRYEPIEAPRMENLPVTPDTPMGEKKYFTNDQEFMKDQQTMVGPNPKGFQGNVPFAQFKSNDVPIVTPQGMYTVTPTFDTMVKRGMAHPDDRDFWEARLEFDQDQKKGFNQKVLPSADGTLKPTPGGGFIDAEGKYVRQDMQSSGMIQQPSTPTTTGPLSSIRSRSDTVLGAGISVYDTIAQRQSNKEEQKIMAKAVKDLALGNKDADWAKPVISAAARFAYQDETGKSPESAPDDYVADWIKKYGAGEQVALGDELDMDLLRKGIAPPGYHVKEPAPPRTATTTPGPGDYTVAFGFNQAYSKPFNKNIPRHRGVDLVLPGPNNGRGKDVGAFRGGTVEIVSKDPNGGNGLIVKSDDGETYDRYFHFDAINVKKGDRVEPGMTIGKLGASGTEGFPHLHYEVSKNPSGDPMNALIDPTPYMKSGEMQTAHAPGDGHDHSDDGYMLQQFQSRAQRGQMVNQARLATGSIGITQMPNQLAGTNPQPGLVAGSGQDGRDMIARVYQRAKEETGDDLFAHSLAALTVAEGGLGGAHGDYGKSTGAFQFYWGGGEGNQFQKWLSQQWGKPVSQKEAIEAAKDIDTSLDYYIQKAYGFFKKGGGKEPLSIALGGHNAGVANVPHLQELYRDAWRRYQNGEVAKGTNKGRTIAGVSGG
jgi:murein DD-endopeptidase MepM/ murein hydrolase activator NlpD